jgi:hypothetical protein
VAWPRRQEGAYLNAGSYSQFEFSRLYRLDESIIKIPFGRQIGEIDIATPKVWPTALVFVS